MSRKAIPNSSFLRTDAELLIGALAIGEGRVQADAKIRRDRLGSIAQQNAQADLLLPGGQSDERLPRREQRVELGGRVCNVFLLAVARHDCSHCRGDVEETAGL